jgi:hypothetical protein
VTLLERALDAHGGRAAWASKSTLDLRYRAGGLAFASKGRGLRLRDWHARVHLDRPHTVFLGYPKPGMRGTLANGHVRIETDSGELVSSRDEPRRTIRAFRHRLRWDDLDLLYFGGYAIWGYATFPHHLTLPGVEVEEAGERTLRVRYPQGWPAHSSEQTYELDESGLLVRNEYTAEPIGDFATAVHLTLEHRTFDGLVFGVRRRVHPRQTARVTLVRIEIDEVRAR